MSQRRITRRTVIIGLLALGALMEGVIAIAILAGGGDDSTPTAFPTHPVAGNFQPNAVKLEDCSEQSCYEQAFGNIAYRQGPKTAMALFDERYGDGSDPGCHRVVHIIGAASLARFKGNVARTFAQGSASCSSGYYHGVLERSLLQVESSNPDALGTVARGLCSDTGIRALTSLTYQCLHGLGHGLMITTGYELPLSLKVCKRLQTKWDWQACNGGVFMENLSSSYGFKSRWLKDDDLLYPCNWVSSDIKVTCYQQVTSRILRVIGLDWKKLAEICSGVEKGWKSTCFQSFGRDVAGQTNRDPAEINKLCALTRPYRGQRSCVLFAAMDLTNNFNGGKQAAVLCNTTLPALRNGCYESIGAIMGRFRATDAARAADCRALSTVAGDVASCTRGATGKRSVDIASTR